MLNHEYNVLKFAVIYASLFDGLIIGVYTFFSFSMPGMTPFYNLDYFPLFAGFLFLSVFSYVLIEYDPTVNVTRCSQFTGFLIIGLCFIPSVFVVLLYALPIVLGSFSFSPSGNMLCFLGPLLLSFFGMLMGSLSFQALKRCVKPVMNRSYVWKKRGLQVGVVLFVIGVISTGFSLSFGVVGETEISYEITVTTSEPTMFFVPIPIQNQTDDYLSFIEHISLVSGNASWNITNTSKGVALALFTNSSCHLQAQKSLGLMSRTEVNELFETTHLSMKKESVDDQSYSVFVFTSTNNTAVDIEFSIGCDLGVWLDHLLDGDLLSNGWQVVDVNKRLATI